jgi:hypothetical protein
VQKLVPADQLDLKRFDWPAEGYAVLGGIFGREGVILEVRRRVEALPPNKEARSRRELVKLLQAAANELKEEDLATVFWAGAARWLVEGPQRRSQQRVREMQGAVEVIRNLLRGGGDGGEGQGHARLWSALQYVRSRFAHIRSEGLTVVLRWVYHNADRLITREQLTDLIAETERREEVLPGLKALLEAGGPIDADGRDLSWHRDQPAVLDRLFGAIPDTLALADKARTARYVEHVTIQLERSP